MKFKKLCSMNIISIKIFARTLTPHELSTTSWMLWQSLSTAQKLASLICVTPFDIFRFMAAFSRSDAVWNTSNIPNINKREENAWPSESVA